MMESPEGLRVTFEIPGVFADEVNLEISDRALILSGDRKMEKGLREENFQRVECLYGPFEARVRLPEWVQSDPVDARCRDGTLEVFLPRARPKKSRRQRVKVES